MIAKEHQTESESIKAADWEIDTSAPFESVKAAVTLFGEGAFSAGKPASIKPKPPTPPSVEKRIAKESQLQLAQKELQRYKEQLQNAETTKAQALDELESARKATSDLVEKLNSTIKSKECAMRAAEESFLCAKELETANDETSWQTELSEARENYVSTMSEIDGVKQELRRMSEEFSVLIHAKETATREATDAEQLIVSSTDRTHDLGKQIAVANISLAHVKHTHMQAMQEQAHIAEASKAKSSVAQQQTHKKLDALRKEIGHENDGDLETKLATKMAEVGSIQKQLEFAKASHAKSVMSVSMDLNEAKGTLHKVVEEEESQRSLLDSLKIELENVRKELQELEEKESEAETTAADLHLKLQKAKSELNMALAAEAKAKGASDEIVWTLKLLSSESEAAKAEADKMRQEAEDLKSEPETCRNALEDAERQLGVALGEAEAAKAAEANALNEVKLLSEKASAARSSTSERGPNIIAISKEEYDSLYNKVNDADTLAGMKVAAAMAQLEAIRASEKEAQKKLESMRKEIEEIKAATEETLKKAEMAEAARNAVEGELKRWQEREQKKRDQNHAQTPPIHEKEDGYEKRVNTGLTKGMEKAHWPGNAGNNSQSIDRSSTSKKKLLLPSLSGIFHRKKSQAEGGMPSYLPGEKLM